MQAMSCRYLLKCHVRVACRHLSAMREGVLLLTDRSNIGWIVLKVRTRHLFRRYQLLELPIMRSWHLQWHCRSSILQCLPSGYVLCIHVYFMQCLQSWQLVAFKLHRLHGLPSRHLQQCVRIFEHRSLH